jgi:hypothetical protein
MATASSAVILAAVGRVCLLSIAILFPLLSISPATAREAPPWPTYAFEVQFGSGGLTGALESLFSGDQKEALAGEIAIIETYLSDVARELQRLGFPAPPMAQGNRGYIVNLYDYDDKASYAQAWLVGDTCVFRMDISRAFVNGKMEIRLLENMGHELFHCVQYAYPMFGHGQTTGDWIEEATAQAVGQDLLWQLRRQEYPRNNPGQRWGARGYHLPLALPDARLPENNFHYYTESFWRYLAEHFAAKRRGGRAGIEAPPPGQADYSFLHELFLNPPSGPSEAAELTWADIGLEGIFGVGLDRLYPDFVSTFAAYVPARATSKRTPPQQMIESWVDIVFGGCQPVELSMDDPVEVVALDLAPVSAQCILLSSSIPDQVDVSIHVHTDSMRTLRSLVIGTAGGDRVGQPVTFGPPAGGGLMGYWMFRLGMDPPQMLIVSNIFEDAADTRAHKVSLTVSVNGWLSSATDPVAEAPGARAAPATRPAPGATPGQTPGAVADPTRAAAAQRVATGLDSLSAHAINGLNVGFNHEEPPCNRPFVLGACGPNTTINLSLAPGSVGGFEHVSGTGGALAQFLTTLSSVADHGLAESSDAMSAAARAIAETKGSTVMIVMPAIDYGFTGPMEGVQIHVNGAGGDELQAIGPQDVQPGPGWMFPQSGSVMIEEFTPFVLRGRFRAPVVNLTRVDWDTIGDDPTLDVSEVVTGSFVIGAPWRGDPRTVMLQTEDPFELAARDLAEFMPLPGADVAERVRSSAPAAGGSGSASGYTVQPMSPLFSCDCRCAPLESFSALCRSVCEPAVLHCTSLEATRAEFANLASRESAITAATEGLRGQFNAFMNSQNWDPAFQAAMLNAFDQQATARDQRNFVRSMGMPLEQIEEEVDPSVARILRMTRDEYIAELKATNVRPELIPELLQIFDGLQVERRGE